MVWIKNVYLEGQGYEEVSPKKNLLTTTAEFAFRSRKLGGKFKTISQKSKKNNRDTILMLKGY